MARRYRTLAEEFDVQLNWLVAGVAPDLAATTKGEIEERRSTVARLRDLTEKAQNGDEEAALHMREILDGSPDLAWRLINGPGKLAESAMIDVFTRDGDLASKGSLEHQLDSMRMEVVGDNPSPLERLLAERVDELEAHH